MPIARVPSWARMLSHGVGHAARGLPLGVPDASAPTPDAPRGLTLLRASAEALSSVEARLVLDVVASGADVLLVCGDNRLDAYGLLARARRAGLEDAVADGVVLARAFTVHQYMAIVEETLPYMAVGRRVGLALVTGALEPFFDEDVTPAEARTLVPRALRSLDAIAARGGFPVVATTHRSTEPLARLAAERARDVRDVGSSLARGPQRRLDAFAAVG